MLLVLEAVRRTSGWIMLFVILLFLAYGFVGPWLPGQWAHRGYDVASLSGFMYQTLEGIFGTAVDVSSSLIILFTIYGAFLQHSGAGKFYLDWSFAAMGSKHSGAGRTVVLASFLLGGPSGSGVATTVTIGSVAYPMLERAGYGKEAAGGLLAAGGLGAIISPPVLGAAAFLIAEFLKIGYLDVLLMAIVPTLLYYLSLFLMVELDTRKFGLPNVALVAEGQLALLTKRYWYHFVSLVAIVAFMVWGFSPMLAVFWATVVTFAVSFLRRDTAMGWRKVIAALRDGSGQMLNVAATCAAAGIIVGVVAKTGPRAQVQRDRHRLCRRQPVSDDAVHGADRVGDRPRRPGDRELHHLRRDRCAGAHQARRPGLRGAHVHLLLRGAVGSVAADRAVAVRRRRDHGRRPLPHDAAGMEVHAARVRRPVSVRAEPRRRGAVAQDAAGRLVAERRLDCGHARASALPRLPRARRNGCWLRARNGSAGRWSRAGSC